MECCREGGKKGGGTDKGSRQAVESVMQWSMAEGQDEPGTKKNATWEERVK